MNGKERRALQTRNMARLHDLGLPADLFSEGFWEREAQAKLRELALLLEFERRSVSGESHTCRYRLSRLSRGGVQRLPVQCTSQALDRRRVRSKH